MTRPPLIDWHTHLFPAELVEALKGRAVEPYLSRRDGRRWLNARAGTDPMPASEGLFSVDQRLADLDRAGIDVQVISVAGLMGVDSATDLGAPDLIARTNAGLGRLVAEHPERFRALASLPLVDPERAADVLQGAVETLGLIGAILPVDAFLTEESAAAFRPILERADTLGAHIFVHPGPLPGAPPPRRPANVLERLRIGTSGIQNGLTEAAITLEFSDLLDGLDVVTVQVANLGGNLAYLAGRWAHTQERSQIEPWDGRLRRIFVDTASLGSRSIELAARVFGPDRLLFGTDAPIYAMDGPAAEARRLGLGFGDASVAVLDPNQSGPRVALAS